jgi:hypothetical protein
MKGICKLCQLGKDLRRSHIVPEFMYQHLYDNDPKRFYTLKIDLEEMDKSTSRIEQKGIREYLLCDECEGKMGKYEDYAAETIYAKRLGNETYITESSASPDHQYFVYYYAGFDYKSFKMFMMSILWRLLISKSFHTPEVPADTLEKLRAALFAENPLAYDDFGCLVQVILYEEGMIAGKFILQPYVTGENQNIINVLIDGFMYSFYLDSKPLSDERKAVFVKPDGTMEIIGRIIFNDEFLLAQAMAMKNFYLNNLQDDEDPASIA